MIISKEGIDGRYIVIRRQAALKERVEGMPKPVPLKERYKGKDFDRGMKYQYEACKSYMLEGLE